MPQLTSWSYSRLLDYEKCPYRLKLKLIDKIPEPPHPAAERGVLLHSASEAFIKGASEDLPAELQSFAPVMQTMRSAYAEGRASVEEEWAFTNKWAPCGWREQTAWLRLKLDVFVRLTPEHGVVIDHKSGKKSGNEIKHMEQGMLYAACCFLRIPELEKVTTEFNYLDLKETSSKTFTAKQAAKAVIMFEKRAAKMLSDTTFRPRPNIFNCRYCAYGPKGTGSCEAACPV